jgi:hypothetical protein
LAELWRLQILHWVTPIAAPVWREAVAAILAWAVVVASVAAGVLAGTAVIVVAAVVIVATVIVIAAAVVVAAAVIGAAIAASVIASAARPIRPVGLVSIVGVAVAELLPRLAAPIVNYHWVKLVGVIAIKLR